MRASSGGVARIPKRQREPRYYRQSASMGATHGDLFLPTHLSLLRALHADDATTGINAADSCPRPSWVEINHFVQLQVSIVERESQARRTCSILQSLAKTSEPTASGDGAHPEPSRKRQRGYGAERNTARSPHSTCPDQGGSASNDTAGSRQTFPAAGVDPRFVVCAKLRRAVRDLEDEQRTACAGLRRLRRGVDDTVDHLASSLDRLVGSRRERATPWRGREGERANEADVVERHSNKLLLWRRLQAALSACRVVVVDEQGQERPREELQSDDRVIS